MQNVGFGNILIGLALLGGLAPAVPAAAVIREAVYTGQISSGTDQSNFFGVGSNLTNIPYRLRFRYDTSIGDLTNFPEGQRLSGGPYNGDGAPLSDGRPTPILFADLSINGVTKRISGNWQGQITAGAFANGPFLNYLVGHIAWQREDLPSLSVNSTYQIFVLTDPATRNLASLQPEIAVSVPWWGNTIWIRETHASAPANNIDVYALMQGPATLQITNAVPEPASWAMMIAGFGLTGGALRRRRDGRIAA